MQKLIFTPENENSVELYIVGQTVIDGKSYLLVSEKEEGDSDALILRDDSKEDDKDALYSIVEDENELLICSKAFRDLLDDVDLV